MFLTISEKILVPIIVAVILAILAIAWKGITDGTLITFLGGVTKGELTEKFKSHQHNPLDLKGAVIAFDLNKGCPEGWDEFSQAESRTIVGASFGNISNSELTPYKFDKEGGEETITISASDIPKHAHEFNDIYYSENTSQMGTQPIPTYPVPDNIGSRATDSDNRGWMIRHKTEPFGSVSEKEFPIMPPYIPLYYCKRNLKQP